MTPDLDAIEAAARRAKPGPYKRRYQRPRMHSLASDCILSAAETDDPDVALADVWIPLPEAGEDALRQQDGLAQMWSLLDPSTVLSLLSQLREARAEADTSLSMLAVLRAEVASLTAIRERAETMKQVGWRNPRTGWLTNKEPRAALDSNEWEAVYVFGDAASGSDCASGSDTNPSPEPLTDVYDLLTDEQRAALREDLAAIARTRQVGLGAAPSPEPPRRCPVTQFPCATCPGECESVLAWRAAAPAPKEETR